MVRRLLTMAEVAEICGVTVARAYELAREGLLPVVRLGRQLRVDPLQLEEWIRNGGQAYPGGWRKEAN
ncbi:helix-turn-helix domain-containing protein [Alicyclobacillus sendaiensis]|uniref:helix-turn-helix domain-containing protein n=1 Tax=Alicyclobacillus sendaiensis TaxID=192387 RepID=UPI000784A191|nr:helix-turn-helix domain-containing protein [Alicyclobacillus sendaiensis]